MRYLLLFAALALPWVRDARPCPNCRCGQANWRSCSYFCYVRTKGNKETPEQRPMTKGEMQTCESLCPQMCVR